MSGDSRIERLKKLLYTRDERKVPEETRTPVSEFKADVPKDWGAAPSFELSSQEVNTKNNAFFNRFFVGSIVFFVIALAVAAFIFFGGFNMISSTNVDIVVTAPTAISSGEELDIGLSIVNQNRADLEDVVLYVDYPEGVESVDSVNQILAHEKIDLGTLSKGTSKEYTLRMLLFGQKDIVKTFSLRLEYKVKGSNATFAKDKDFDVLIGSAPLFLNVTYPKEVNSGQDVTIDIEITSNAVVVLKNTIVKVEYPYGFTYVGSNMKPIRENSVWNIGDLKGGDKKTLSIRGTIVGQNQEERSFRISAGTETSPGKGDFDAELANSQITLGIRKSFFNLSIGSGAIDVTEIGQFIPVLLRWDNTLPEKIVDARIEASFSGNVFDRSSVSAGNGGFYRSTDNTIFWDKNSDKNLQLLLPGANGSVSFSVSSFKDSPQVRATKNPHINIHMIMFGERSGEDASTVSSTLDLTVKFLSQVVLTAKSLRTFGPFGNSGPIPPKAEQETTYTLAWTLTNTTNDLKDATVSAKLPLGVEWKGEVSPPSEKIVYSPDNRTVQWNIGSVFSGTGFTYSPREVFFKVAISPSLSQIGTVPTLISESSLSYTDVYTETAEKRTVQAVTTAYTDSSFTFGDETVKP